MSHTFPTATTNLDWTHLEENFEILQLKLAEIKHHFPPREPSSYSKKPSSSMSSCSTTVDSTNTNTDHDSSLAEEEVSIRSSLECPFQTYSSSCEMVVGATATNLEMDFHHGRFRGDVVDILRKAEDENDGWSVVVSPPPPRFVLPPPTPTDEMSVVASDCCCSEEEENDDLIDITNPCVMMNDVWIYSHDDTNNDKFHCDDEHNEDLLLLPLNEIDDDDVDETHSYASTRRIWPPSYQFYSSIFQLKLQLFSYQSTHRYYSSVPVSLFCQ